MLAKILLVLLLILVIAGVIAVLMIDPAARRAVEQGTSYATGTESTLDSATVGLREGDVLLSSLAVANPEGFEGRLLELSSMHADIDVRTLLGDVLRIPELRIDGLVLHVVQDGTRSNLTPILARLRELGEHPPGAPPERPEGDAGRRAVIDRMVISGLEIRATLKNVSLPGLDQLSAEDSGFTFPDIVLEDLGEPRTIGEWMGVIVEVAFEALKETGLPGEWREELNAYLGEAQNRAVEEARELLKGVEIPGLEERVPEQLDRAREGVERALEGVLPGRDN